MAKKELTERESMKNLTLSTLEQKLIQSTLGANLASDITKYGTSGKESSEKAFNGKEIKEAREKEYNKLMKEYKSMGVAGEPTYPSNSDISYKVIQGLENVMRESYIGDLAEGVNKYVTGLNFNLPEKLKGHTYNGLVQKAAEEKDGKVSLNPKKLNEDERVLLGVYENLREAYRKTAAKKVIDSNYLGDVKSYLDSVTEKYSKQEEK